MKKIFIVTINYNTAEDTKKMLASLEKLHHPDFSLHAIVVDNASREKFSLDNKGSIETTVLRSETNKGFAGGSNFGIEYALKAGADYVLLLNNDTIVDRNLISQLLKELESKKEIGITVPKIYFAKGYEYHKDRYKSDELGNVFWYAGGYTDWSHVFSKHRGMDEVDHKQYDRIENTSFATGCCMLVKKEVFEKVGFFNEKYFLYFEDADFSERVQKAGYIIVYVPQAKLWHMTSASTGGSGSALHDYFLTRNRMMFGFMYAPLRAKIALTRESLRLFSSGRKYQKRGIKDFYTGKFGQGSFFEK